MTTTALHSGFVGRLGLPARSLHLIDIENLLGTGDFTRSAAVAARDLYRDIVGIGPADLVTIASNHSAMLRTADWPEGARRLVRSGTDGADQRLLAVLEHEQIAARFTRVVIASGDGIFAEPGARLQHAGCAVTVVSRPESLSRRLSFAVRDQVAFTATATSAPAALRGAA